MIELIFVKFIEMVCCFVVKFLSLKIEICICKILDWQFIVESLVQYIRDLVFFVDVIVCIIVLYFQGVIWFEVGILLLVIFMIKLVKCNNNKIGGKLLDIYLFVGLCNDDVMINIGVIIFQFW